MAGREKAPKAGPEEKVVTYLAPGVRVDPYAGNEPSLDPDLEKVRDEEAKALAEVKVFRASDREDASIDPELVKARDAEAKRGAKVLGGVLAKAEAPVAEEPKPAKKSAAKKSSK